MSTMSIVSLFLVLDCDKDGSEVRLLLGTLGTERLDFYLALEILSGFHRIRDTHSLELSLFMLDVPGEIK